METKNEKVFDLMILRELARQTFWNSIFHMVQYDMPFDIFVPYEGAHLIQNLKFANRHTSIIISDKDEVVQFPQNVRRNKSVFS